MAASGMFKTRHFSHLQATLSASKCNAVPRCRRMVTGRPSPALKPISHAQQRQQSTSTKRSPPEWLSKVINTNHTWANDFCTSESTLMSNLSKGQQPEILWLGCSDSRVPETTLLGLKPGDVFVHRNIANIIHATDLSALSVIEYAVVYLKVKHIIVCGHSSCGGVAAALGNNRLGKIDTWLMPLRQVRMKHAAELQGCATDGERTKKLVELNVRNSVEAVRENPDVMQAVRERGLDVHGLVYDLASGKLELVGEEGTDALEQSRAYAFDTK